MLAVLTEAFHEITRPANASLEVSRAILEEIRPQQTTRIARLEARVEQLERRRFA